MKIAVRCIYYKAVTPSCDIIELPYDQWMTFLHGDASKRKEIVCSVLEKDYMLSSIREVAWIPLDGQDKIKVI